VADAVMRMPEPEVQRQVEPEEEEIIQLKPIAEEIAPLVQKQIWSEEGGEDPIQTERASGQTPQVDHSLEAQIHHLRGGGQSLPAPARAFFESRFGYDFSHVRLHTDSKAVEAARSVNAKAFTIGKDVVFGAGEYSPETLGGRQLLAHELTHVIQQQSRPLGLQRQSVVLQASNPSDDGSLSVLFAQQRYINLETWHGRGLDENVRQAEAALRHLGVSRGCSQSPAECNAVTPSLPSSPLAPASSPAAEEIQRTPHKQENRFLINNTQGILADLKKNLVIQRRILIGRRPITEDEEERERRHEITVEERNLLHRPRTLVANIIYRHRDLADRIIDDMEESGEDLYFRDLDELRREIATRIETSTAMQATQEGPGSRAFAYPRRGRNNYYGPRVNYAAREYWEPSVPDNYRVRRPAEAMHPSDPDLAQGGAYHFTLNNAGRLNGYQALMSLFEPQSHVRHKTLIHCDRLANLIHFRSFAVTLGSREFNRRVEGGIIPLVLRYNGYFDIRYSDVVGSVVVGTGPATRVHLRVVNPNNRRDFLIGDHVVFHNHRHYDLLMEIAGRTGVWRLEHAILIDRQGSDPERDDIFLGHGSGRRNEQGIKRVLRTHFNNMVGHARRMLLRDYIGLERRFSGRLTRSGREFYFERWRIHEITENDVPGLYDPRTYPGGSLFQVHRPAESRRD
jgi:hypothetical protein